MQGWVELHILTSIDANYFRIVARSSHHRFLSFPVLVVASCCNLSEFSLSLIYPALVRMFKSI